MIGQSAKKSVEVPPVSCVFRCRMWHVSGVIFVKCFLFPFLPYSISCVFTVLFPYTSGFFLYMCDYWSCIIGWVCLTTARVLCSPSDLYMPVHPMCNNHGIAFDVSPPLWLSLRLAFCQTWPFLNLHLVTTLRMSCHVLSSHKSGKKNLFRHRPCSKFSEIARNLLVKLHCGHFPGLSDLMLMESIFCWD